MSFYIFLTNDGEELCDLTTDEKSHFVESDECILVECKTAYAEWWIRNGRPHVTNVRIDEHGRSHRVGCYRNSYA